MRFKLIQLDDISKLLLICVILAQLLLNNGFYLFISMATLGILFFFTQQVQKPGIFTLILIQHFLQICAGVWLCNYLDKDINYRCAAQGTAIVLSCVGLIALFIPLIYAQAKMPSVSLAGLRQYATLLSTEKVMYFYIASFFVASFLGAIAFTLSSITQIIISLIKIKWCFFLLFGFICMLKNEKKNIFYLFIALEILSGFFSIFSDFKTVLYYLLALLLTFLYSISIKHLLIGGIIGTFLMSVGLLWTSVKGDYRAYLNGGTKQQVIVVSKDDALNKLYDLSNSVDEDKLNASTVDFLDRLQYTYYFAKTIDRVPDAIPYQNGKNWLDVIEFCTTPRYFNPDKPTIDNSVKTAQYTGIRLLGAKSGVSFSLGYFAECYIDFGVFGVIIILLLIGYIYASIYKYLMHKSSNNLLFNYAVVGSFFMEFNALEMDGTYFLGRLLASVITYLLLVQFFFPWVMSQITIKEKKDN